MARRFTDEERVFREAYAAYRKSARRRGIAFSLSESQAYELFGRPCYYCGGRDTKCIRLSGTKRIANTNQVCTVYCGIDRFDNKRGYSLDNIRPCCRTCNVSKNMLSADAWANWLAALIKHQISNYMKGNSNAA
jgi:hypothetical protein